MIRRALLGLLLLFAICVPTPSWAACTGADRCVQRGESFTAGVSSPTLVLTNNVAAGNCIALYAVDFTNSTAFTSIGTDFGATCVIKDSAVFNTSYRGMLAYCYAATGGGKTITVNLAAADNTLIEAHEVSSCLATDPYDNSRLNPQTDPGTGSNAITSLAITTTCNGDYIFGVSQSNTAGTYTAGTGYTGAYNSSAAANEYISSQGSAGSTTVTFTYDQATGNFQTGVLALKPGGGCASASGGVCVIGGGIIGTGCPN